MKPFKTRCGIIFSIDKCRYSGIRKLMNLNTMDYQHGKLVENWYLYQLTLTNPTRFNLGQFVASSNTDRSVKRASPARSMYRNRLHPRANLQTPQSVNLQAITMALSAQTLDSMGR
jgi:hypothetical protein